jgi:subtilisin family serine protease
MPVSDLPTFGHEPGEPRKRLTYVPGQLIMRVHEEAVRPELAGARLMMSAEHADRLPQALAEPLDFLRRHAGLSAIEPVFSARRDAVKRARVSDAQRRGLAVLSSVADSASEELAGISVVSVAEKEVTPALLRRLNGARAVDYVEQMPARWLSADPDPMQNLQWGLRAINWFDAAIPTAGDVRVAVLDTGVDTTHPDLQGVVAEYHHSGLKAEDIVGHGTHVSGIIAARTNNAVGISGVAGCRIGVWKIFPDKPIEGDFYVDGGHYLRALNAVTDAGVRVVNLSIGGSAHSQTEALLFRRLDRFGIVACAAMGNEYQQGNPVEYPAAYEGVVSVGAMAENRLRSRFSNVGPHIDLVAPGSNILSTLPTKRSAYRDETDYASWSGTSMATPHVAAAAALVAARHRDWTAAQIVDRLRKTTAHLPGLGSSTFTNALGTGLLNLRSALA